jgi:excinuclease ABC subunit C
MEFSQKIKQKVAALPHSPGVYLMKDHTGEIIYVGKAKNLKNRVSQYFQSRHGHSLKVSAMVDRIEDFDYIVTDSEFEALVLECNLIKLHRPHYNILLKDDKQYPFIRVTMQEPYPKIMLARQKKEDGSRYFGPYPGAGAVREIIRQIQSIFMIATCKRKFPADIGRGRPCLNYHIKRCLAPCLGKVTQEEYHRLFEEIIQFLEGKYTAVTDELRRQMEIFAENMEFEKAARCRDKIRFVEQIGEKQKVYTPDGSDRDIVAQATDGIFTCFSILRVRSGKLIYKDSHIFQNLQIGDDTRALEQFIAGYYSHQGGDIPPQIVTEPQIGDSVLLCKMLSELSGRRVEVRVPKRGELVKMLAMARENAKEELLHTATKAKKQELLLIGVAKVLGLSTPPGRIEAFDIANTKNDAIVGAMVVYKDGAKDKESYRRFGVRSISGQDDYAATKEVIYRRIAKGQEGDPGFLPMPDLILLDGGRGHVSSVGKMLEELGITIPLFGMVKDGRHHLRGLIGPEGELELSGGSPVFTLFGQISDEVHRFALDYHKKARAAGAKRSILAQIPGVGEKRRKALLAYFGSVKKIAQAKEEELCEVKSITPSVAREIRRYFEEVSK